MASCVAFKIGSMHNLPVSKAMSGLSWLAKPFSVSLIIIIEHVVVLLVYQMCLSCHARYMLAAVSSCSVALSGHGAPRTCVTWVGLRLRW